LDHGSCLYVARAWHKGSLVPGKLNPKHRRCYVSWGGEEHAKSEYEVLVGSDFAWVPRRPGSSLPPGAVQAGHEANGDPLYVARGRLFGTNVIGKVGQRLDCHVPYGGSEHRLREHEVLVKTN
jgi:hypothetical protein